MRETIQRTQARAGVAQGASVSAWRVNAVREIIVAWAIVLAPLAFLIVLAWATH